MRCFKGCFGSKEAEKLLRKQQQPLLSVNEEEREVIEPLKEFGFSLFEDKEEEKISSSNERNHPDDNPEKSSLQERTVGACPIGVEDRRTASMESEDSLFSLSIDSRKQFRAITKEQGENEAISPLKEMATPRVESNNKKVDDDKENAKPNENRTMAATASFSSWLGGGGSSGRPSNTNSPESEKNYIGKASAKAKRKEFNKELDESLRVRPTPSCRVDDDGGGDDDDRYSEGTIGRYLQTKKRFKVSGDSFQV